MGKRDTPLEVDKEIIERGPGSLTEGQRRYLLGDSDIEPGSQRERTSRSRIRERIINGIDDTVLGLYYLDDRDLSQIEEYFNREAKKDVLYTAIRRLIALTGPTKVFPDQAIDEDEHNLGSDPDVVLDVIPEKMSDTLVEAYWHRYQQMDEQSWVPVDGELSGQVGFDRVDSKELPDDVEKSVEFRNLLLDYEEGSVSKKELIENFPFKKEE